ncbi:MAG: radical SAM protein [Candidatus Omnitrophota bacterium]
MKKFLLCYNYIGTARFYYYTQMGNSVYIINCPPGWVKTPPLSLLYLNKYLKNNGAGVRILDLNTAVFQLFAPAQKEWLCLNENLEKNLFPLTEKTFPYLLENIYKTLNDFPVIGFTLTKRNRAFSFELARRIKDKFPEKKIVMGGPHTFFLERRKELLPDYSWVIGEGEISLLKILTDKKIKNVYRFFEIDDLDTLGFLDFSPLNLKAYSPALPVLSSRGCTHKCVFCSERKLYRKFRQHSAQYTVDQISYLQKKYSINRFIFCDSQLNYNDRWLNDFSALIIRKNIGIKWEAQMRIKEDFPRSLARKLKLSGCYNIFIGLESGSDRMLSLMNKGFTTDAALDFFKILTKEGLHFEVSLIFGYPKEEDKDFKETLNFIIGNRQIIPKIAQANPFVDYLGNFPHLSFPAPEAKQRIQKFLSAAEDNKIKYTKSFINNLIYG